MELVIFSIGLVLMVAGAVTLIMGNSMMNAAKDLLEDALITDRETNDMLERIHEEYDLDEDPLDGLLDKMPRQTEIVFKSTLEDVRLELGHEDAKDVVDVLTLLAALSEEYGPSVVAKAMFSYADYAHNLKEAGIEPTHRGE